MAADRRRAALAAALALALMAAPAREAQAASIGAALTDIMAGVVSLPLGILDGTLRGPLLLGTVGGALRGAFNTVGFGLRGAFGLVSAAIPLAARLVPLIPVFL
jgi:hypothetical protein